jgi:hypothetical protein
VVVASVVGVLDVFTLEVEVGASPVRRGSILGELERLRGGFTLEVEVGASPVRRGSIRGELERLRVGWG